MSAAKKKNKGAIPAIPKGKERDAILRLLNELTRAVEDLLLSGLAAASTTTEETMRTSAAAASQMHLLRLGSTLRIVTEELGRFATNDSGFSRRRFAFFLNRAWMLARGMRASLEAGDAKAWGRFNWAPGGRVVQRLEVVTLGVSRRVVPGAFCAFEFRLRTLKKLAQLPAGSPLIWATVFPLKKAGKIPPEAYLHLPQKQKFAANDFLQQAPVTITKARLTDDGRIRLEEKSKVTVGEAHEEWEAYAQWDPAGALARINEAETTPFDLDIELQEEVVLRDWNVEKPEPRGREEGIELTLRSGDLEFTVRADPNSDAHLLKALKAGARKKPAPDPLFGIVHYEACALILQPLSLLAEDGPDPISINKTNIDHRELLQGLGL